MRIWTAVVVLAALSVASITRADERWMTKPWQWHIGIVSPTGDVKDNGDAKSGMLLGFDYTLRAAENSYSFLGARWWRAEAQDPFAYINWGMHWGMQWNLNRDRMGNGGLYAKAALGIYTSAFKTTGDIFGSIDPGGWIGFGWEAGGDQMWGLEFTYYIMPEIGSDNNNGWTFAVTFRP